MMATIHAETCSMFYRPRLVPYVMRGKVEKELEHLEQQGVIKQEFVRELKDKITILL